MLKVGIMACAICMGAGGTALLLKERNIQSQDTVKGMPSLLELHNNAYLENLPVQDIKDRF